MTWDTATHRHTTRCMWAGPVAQDVRRRHAARYSSLGRAPCASRSPCEPTAPPSKSPRCSTSRSSGCAASHCRSRLKPQVGSRTGRRSLAVPRRRSPDPSCPLPIGEALAQAPERPRHRAKAAAARSTGPCQAQHAKTRRRRAARARRAAPAVARPYRRLGPSEQPSRGPPIAPVVGLEPCCIAVL
jgi:hypothetical protein